MSHRPAKSLVRRALPILALGTGFLLGHPTPWGSALPSAEAAGAMSPAERLLIEDDIRQRLALYMLYADGDGIEPQDTRSLANELMTSDSVNEMYPSGGGAVITQNGREPVAASHDMVEPTMAARHFIVSTYFDEVSPTTAKTRSTAVHFKVTRNMIGADCKKAGEDACGGRVVKTSMWVYHMTWTKTANGWQISRNVLRDLNT